MIKGEFCYPYPRPAVTVDILLITNISSENEILLIERNSEPFKGMWALPGGFVDENEDLLDAAIRELIEETGIQNVALTQFGAFGKPGRDPRGHTVSIVYITQLPSKINAIAGDDAAKIKWFSVDKLPELAFDHRDIIDLVVSSL